MRRVIVSLVAVAWSIVAATGASASVTSHANGAPDGIGISLVAVPGGSPATSLATSYVVDRLAPGTSVRRTIEIDNSTKAVANVSVYSAGASIVGGRFLFDPSHSQNDLARWTRVGRDELHLAPGAEALDALTIRVPKDAASGTRYAVVWAEVSSSPPTAGGVRLVNRVGVRIYLSVGRGGTPAAKFTVGSLRAQRAASGAPLVAARVRNGGDGALDLSGTLTLSKGPGGLATGPFPVTVGAVLAPGDSETATVLLNAALPRGPWRADLRLKSGLTQRSAVAAITFPAETVSKPPPARFPPTVAIVAVAFTLLTATVGTLLVNRRRIPGRTKSRPRHRKRRGRRSYSAGR